MHIVYLMKFNREQLPNLYIGSKSNCSFIDGKILDKSGKLYEGSCKSDSFLEARETCSYVVFILGAFGTYNEALLLEKDCHIINDVVASTFFFNRAIATISNYANPDFATYKNISTDKVARLPRMHPEVLNGNWVGVTKGVTLSEEERAARGRSGIENGFYGKTHSDETLEHLSEIAIIRGSTSWDGRSDESKNIFLDMAKQPKSEEHKNKIGRKGMIMLQNIQTLKYIRIPKEDVSLYDPNIWMHYMKVRKILKNVTLIDKEG